MKLTTVAAAAALQQARLLHRFASLSLCMCMIFSRSKASAVLHTPPAASLLLLLHFNVAALQHGFVYLCTSLSLSLIPLSTRLSVHVLSALFKSFASSLLLYRLLLARLLTPAFFLAELRRRRREHGGESEGWR